MTVKLSVPIAAAETEAAWQVYLLRCADDSLYTGVATNVERRLQQHNGELSGGARYTRSRRPVSLVWRENCDDRSHALRREAEIKNLSRVQKVQMIDDCVLADPPG